MIAVAVLALPIVMVRKFDHSTAGLLVPAAYVLALLSLQGFVTFGLSTVLFGDFVRYMALGALFALAASRSVTTREITRFYVISCLPAALISVAGGLASAPWATNATGRVAGTFSHSNAAGAYFAVAALAGLGLWIVTRSRSAALVALLNLFGLLITQSLGGVIGLAGGVGAIVLFNARASATTRWITLLLSGLIALAGLTRTSVFGRIAEFRSVSIDYSLNTAAASDSFTWRIVNWVQLVDIWRESPIWGHGLGTTSYIQPLGTFAHSMPIEILVETGVVGLALATAILVSGLRMGVSLSKALHPLGPLTVGLLVFVVLNGSESNLLRYTAADFLLAALLGLAMGARRFQRDGAATLLSTSSTERT
ncbi:O-antigen ligase family protein [Nocardioides sp. W7]|uniref:O-antigen ligase family protein n=1 Tax=Nocardioides sp. W7 TaxID=2931390 RepID=UPI001FD62F99|nr:O-antigen ligase family protein [Nocardioides sp. W7]